MWYKHHQEHVLLQKTPSESSAGIVLLKRRKWSSFPLRPGVQRFHSKYHTSFNDRRVGQLGEDFGFLFGNVALRTGMNQRDFQH
jgi:hypothetical protein